MIESNGSLRKNLSPESEEIVKRMFGSKDNNSEFNDGYKKGYADGWLDAKNNQPYNDVYSWNKYSDKK